VVWYSGASGRFVPVSYSSLSSATFQTMAPCGECTRMSELMVKVARGTDS
jgi:hypothetical protein